MTRLTDEELAACDGSDLWDWDVKRVIVEMGTELRERRAADLSAEELVRLVLAFVNQVSAARRQRDARGTGGMGAGLPGDVLSYVQPSALNELVRTARDMEIAVDRLIAASRSEKCT